MKLFIPTIGTKMVLTSPWTFSLISERRNDTFIDALRPHFKGIPAFRTHDHIYWYRSSYDLCQFTFGVGTTLTIDRIYIRKGSKDYDSVSFYVILHTPTGGAIKGRFWAKLSDVNEINADLI